jgi:hypothetical protein
VVVIEQHIEELGAVTASPLPSNRLVARWHWLHRGRPDGLSGESSPLSGCRV